MRKFLIGISLYIITTIPASAAKVSRSTQGLNGHTISIDSVTVRLHGIDALENGQDCRHANGKKFNCGAAAEKQLKALLTGTVNSSGNNFDDYGRLIGICSSGGKEINREMVSSGWALAFRKFSEDYISEEASAKAAGRALWAGSFAPP